MYAFSLLGDSRSEARYAALAEGLLSRRTSIPCGGGPGEISRALLAVLIDHPALFWFEGRWQYDGLGAVCPLYLYDAAQIAAGQAALRACLREVTPLRSLPPAERARALYQWLTGYAAYGLGGGEGQNAYDALIRRRAVCKGLSKAYQLLCESLGLFCTLARGTLDGRTPHVWNILQIDGRFCHADVSMAYPRFSALYPPEERGNALRGFGLSDARLRRTHIPADDGFPRPVCAYDYRSK